MRGIALVATGVAALAVIPAASGTTKPVNKTAKVGDYFITPGKVTVPRRSRVVWKWLNSNGDTHDIKLVKKPKGAKGFHSEYASTSYSFGRKLTVRGKYVVICTLHPDKMRQTIVVK